jgi:hypothetical protein
MLFCLQFQAYPVGLFNNIGKMDHVVSLGENLRCNIIINGEYKEEII